MKFTQVWLIIIASALFILCDSLAAHWGKNGNKISLMLFFIIAPLGYVTFGYLNKIKTLSISSGLVNMALLIGTVLVGILIFHDQVTIKQYIGLGFAVIAMTLML